MLTALIAGAILNIGILLDPRPFIEAQSVQSQMSFRSASPGVTIETWVGQLLSRDTGLPVLALLGVAALWVLGIAQGSPRVRLLLCVFAIGWIVATVIVCSITGSRQPSHLWLPYLVLGFVAAAIGSGALTDASKRPLRLIGYAGFVLLFASAVIRLAPILMQATAPAMGGRIAAIVRNTVPPGTKLVSNIDLTGHLPLSLESQNLPRARDERLVINYLWVIGGLEEYRADRVRVVLPFAWPLQPEEWQLALWLARSFHFFVVGGMANRINDPVPAYRAFFRALDRCRRVATVPAARPLFGEQDTRVYRCA